VDVDHGRRDIRMAHVRLHVGQREDLDGEGAEAVAEVVKADFRALRKTWPLTGASRKWIEDDAMNRG
jgi:hypothetical protein